MGARPYVAFGEQIAFLLVQVDLIDEHPQSDIELAALKQQWSLDILLYDKDLRVNILLQVYR